MSKVFTVKVPSMDTRRRLDILFDCICEGDTLMVQSMGRLARNLDDLRRLV